MSRNPKYEINPGDRFNQLVVIGRGEKRGPRWLIHARCDCGNETNVERSALVKGTTKSCGCLMREVGNRTRTHGLSKSSTYRSWLAMRSRCENPNNIDWQHYGGRGITVCQSWNTFENFLTDMGRRPNGTSIDRINNAGNYEPANCRWASETTQQRNRRNNKLTETVAASIRSDAASGMSSHALGRKYGIAQTTAADIVRGDSWATHDARQIASGDGGGGE
jgi:hypothetical protein